MKNHAFSSLKRKEIIEKLLKKEKKSLTPGAVDNYVCIKYMYMIIKQVLFFSARGRYNVYNLIVFVLNQIQDNHIIFVC